MKYFILIFAVGLSFKAYAIKVLQIGDSQTVGNFGDGLYNSFKNSTTIHSIGLAGSSANQWSADNPIDRTLNQGYISRPEMKSISKSGTVEKLSTLLDKNQPDMLIVELAGNFAGYRKTVDTPNEPSADDYAKKQVQKILTQISLAKHKAQECYWIGPTWTDKVDANGKPTSAYKKTNTRVKALSDLIEKEIAGKCKFVNSTTLMKQEEIKTADGLHCDKTSGNLWGKRAYENIYNQSSLLKTTETVSPPKSTGGTNN
jgi:hypothetical protein